MVARINKVGFLALLFLSIFYSETSVYAGTSKEVDLDCPLFGAEYVPHPSYKVHDQLDFVLRITGPDQSNSTTVRTMFLLFEAYNKSGTKVSSMRFGDAWSNGASRQNFSTYYGQYNDLYNNEVWTEFKPSASFYPIGVNSDMSPQDISNTPDLLIFSGTYWELTHKSFQVPEHWDKYIKFYTEDKIYPDFRGYDFWVRKKCGNGGTK